MLEVNIVQYTNHYKRILSFFLMAHVSLKMKEENSFELAKLAVNEKYQGLKIGRKLMEVCFRSVYDRESGQDYPLYKSCINFCN